MRSRVAGFLVLVLTQLVQGQAQNEPRQVLDQDFLPPHSEYLNTLHPHDEARALPRHSQREAGKPARCFLKAEFGNCKGSIKRWYYQHASDSCVPFSYSGCGPDVSLSNNFDTYESCMRSCATPVLKEYDGDETPAVLPDRKRTLPSFKNPESETQYETLKQEVQKQPGINTKTEAFPTKETDNEGNENVQNEDLSTSLNTQQQVVVEREKSVPSSEEHATRSNEPTKTKQGDGTSKEELLMDGPLNSLFDTFRGKITQPIKEVAKESAENQQEENTDRKGTDEVHVDPTTEEKESIQGEDEADKITDGVRMSEQEIPTSIEDPNTKNEELSETNQDSDLKTDVTEQTTNSNVDNDEHVENPVQQGTENQDEDNEVNNSRELQKPDSRKRMFLLTLLRRHMSPVNRPRIRFLFNNRARSRYNRIVPTLNRFSSYPYTRSDDRRVTNRAGPLISYHFNRYVRPSIRPTMRKSINFMQVFMMRPKPNYVRNGLPPHPLLHRYYNHAASLQHAYSPYTWYTPSHHNNKPDYHDNTPDQHENTPDHHDNTLDYKEDTTDHHGNTANHHDNTGLHRDVESDRYVDGKQYQDTRHQREVCLQRLDLGYCQRFVRQWFFNTYTGRCERFIFGGCGGNGNRFDSEQECFSTCMTSMSASEKSPRPEVDEKEEAEHPTPNFDFLTTVKAKNKEIESSTTQKSQKPTTAPDHVQVKHSSMLLRKGMKTLGLDMSNDLEYATVVAIMCVIGITVVVLVCVTSLYVFRKCRKTKKEISVEEVLKAHMYGDLPKMAVGGLACNQAPVHGSQSTV